MIFNETCTQYIDEMSEIVKGDHRKSNILRMNDHNQMNQKLGWMFKVDLSFPIKENYYVY